jgi:serine/threonine protein kinase
VQPAGCCQSSASSRSFSNARERSILHSGPASFIVTSSRPISSSPGFTDPNEGEIKISDFGAAIIGSPDRTLILGMGSPAYMSPQQVKDHTLDHQTDIYSLGVVMYQLLTGQLPFQARNSYDLIYQIIHSEPRRPSRYAADIPLSLDNIVARAMSKKLENRYTNWAEFRTRSGADLPRPKPGRAR